jgi:amino acid permease
MKNLILSKSKRLKTFLLVFVVYVLTGWITLLIEPSALSGMAMYMGALTIPVVGYLLSESWRPSTKDE